MERNDFKTRGPAQTGGVPPRVRKKLVGTREVNLTSRTVGQTTTGQIGGKKKQEIQFCIHTPVKKRMSAQRGGRRMGGPKIAVMRNKGETGESTQRTPKPPKEAGPFRKSRGNTGRLHRTLRHNRNNSRRTVSEREPGKVGRG